jgi:hypothetical protein
MPKDLVINEFNKGMGDSPNTGFGKMVNVDIHTISGAVQASLRSEKKSASVVTGLINRFVTNPSNGHVYAIDDTNVYVSTNSGETWSLDAANGGNDAVIWKGFLLIFASTVIRAKSLTSGTWTVSWQAITAGDHPAIAAANDKVYFGNGRYVGSIQETTGLTFDPGTGSTYNINTQALDLPQDYEVTTIAELRQYLMNGAGMDNSSVAELFPWDRSASSFELPIKIPEKGINQTLTVGNTVYVTAGNTNTLYATNGVGIEKLKELKFLELIAGGTVAGKRGALIHHSGRILFGLSMLSSLDEYAGVYSYKDGALTIETRISSNGGAEQVIGALHSLNREQYLIGWSDSDGVTTTYEIDLINASNPVAGYNAYFETPLFKVGTTLQKRKFRIIEIDLDKEITGNTGTGIKVYYRTQINQSYTLVKTFEDATMGTIKNISSDWTAQEVDTLQLKVEIKSAGSTSPRIREIRLR